MKTDGWLSKLDYESYIVGHLLTYFKCWYLIDNTAKIDGFSFGKRNKTNISGLEKVLCKYDKPYIEATNSTIVTNIKS